MKTNKKLLISDPGRAGLSSESELCFGAAGGCFVIGMIGYGFSALAATETTLSAFLVISALYGSLGVASLFKKHAVPDSAEVNEQVAEEKFESAA